MRALLAPYDTTGVPDLAAGLKGLGWEVTDSGGAEGCDLVAVNLRAFEPGDAIDIGGPAMLRAAAKNFADVIVLCDPADYEPTLAALQGRRRHRRAAAGAGREGVPARRPLRHAGRALPARRRRPVCPAELTWRCASAGPGAALRREPAPDGGALRGGRAAGSSGIVQRQAAARRADLLQQRPRRRRRLAHGQRLRRRRRSRSSSTPTPAASPATTSCRSPTSARWPATRSRPSAASSPATGRSTASWRGRCGPASAPAAASACATTSSSRRGTARRRWRR